jgi:hypothetical protein
LNFITTLYYGDFSTGDNDNDDAPEEQEKGKNRQERKGLTFQQIPDEYAGRKRGNEGQKGYILETINIDNPTERNYNYYPEHYFTVSIADKSPLKDMKTQLHYRDQDEDEDEADVRAGFSKILFKDPKKTYQLHGQALENYLKRCCTIESTRKASNLKERRDQWNSTSTLHIKVEFVESPQYFFDHWLLMLKDEIHFNAGGEYSEDGKCIDHLKSVMGEQQLEQLWNNRAIGYFKQKLDEQIKAKSKQE